MGHFCSPYGGKPIADTLQSFSGVDGNSLFTFYDIPKESGICVDPDTHEIFCIILVESSKNTTRTYMFGWVIVTRQLHFHIYLFVGLWL
jgi:hypothetical protein